MPAYEITAPDGSRFEISAPDGATEQQIMSYAKSQFETEQPKQEKIPLSRAIPEKLMQGAMHSFYDEAQAGVEAKIGEYMYDTPFDDGYDFALDNARAMQERISKERPVTSLLSEVAGAGLTGAGVYGALPKGLQAAAAARPFISATGFGAASGGLYNAGESEKSLMDRGGDMGRGAAIGFGFGAFGGYLGNKAARLFGAKKSTEITSNQMRSLPSNKDLGRLAQGQDDVFAKTKGQRTQNPKDQRLENDSVAGVYGDKAEMLARKANIAQSRQRSDFLSILGDMDKVGNSGEMVEGVVDVIKSQSKSLKGEVNNAYELARSGGGTKISTDDIKDGLFSRIVDVKRDGQYDLGLMPQATARMNDLTRLVRKTSGGKFTSANLSTMENFRKRVTNSLHSTQDKTEKKFLGDVLSEYDDFMYRTANEAVEQADKDSILAFRKAVNLRREYGKLYESDKFVNDIIGGKKGLDDTVKDLIGTGSIVGKKRMESTLDALLKASGDEVDMVKADLRSAFAKKLLEQSISGIEAGGDQAFLSAAKTQTALKGLFVNNRNFSKKLFGDDIYNVSIKAIEELEKISKLQPSVANPSGSGEMVMRLMRGKPFLNFLPAALDSAKNEARTLDVQKSLKDVIGETVIPSQSQLFSQSAGAASLGGQAGGMQ